ncbi:MAG TPA: hypothetical protein VMU30_11895 [Bacteroidota bacterium]|nr:hypothetical protein [Bacteroidota bacterium]
MKHLFVVLLCHIIFTSLMVAQGEYISRGTNAYSGSLLMQTNSEATAYGFQAGYSYKGFLDAGLTFIKANAGDFKNGILSPSMTYYIVKQEDDLHAPTVGVTFSYRHYPSTNTSAVAEPDSIPAISYYTKNITTTQTLDAYIFDVTAHKRIGYWNVFFFQPMLGGGISMTRADWNVCLRGGLEIGTRMVHGPLLVLVPSLEYQSTFTSFALNLQVVF